ncbi:MAG: thiamine pyrophosphate-binding protein, partial [Synergistaceae bacterium]
MKMTGAQILLEMLKVHDVRHIFGLPGETTLGLYRDWLKCNEIEHILTHDERAAAFMAEAYAKVTGRVGISEAPSPGGGHPVPGVIESFTGAVPTICFTSDVPFNNDKRNMLSGFDQNRLYSAITKESILISKAKDIPFLIRRAFRVALSGRPGAVHVRIPMDIYVEEAEVNDIFADPCMAKWPAYRPVADLAQIDRALELIASAERPVIVCGQGALVSEAGDEVIALAEHFRIPVGCTMTAKGTVSEVHPLSIRLIGARGGTSYSNKFLETADLVFFVGSNTDSAGTDA